MIAYIKRNYEKKKCDLPMGGLSCEKFFLDYPHGFYGYAGFLRYIVFFYLNMKEKDYDGADGLFDHFVYNKLWFDDFRCYMMWMRVAGDLLNDEYKIHSFEKIRTENMDKKKLFKHLDKVDAEEILDYLWHRMREEKESVFVIDKYDTIKDLFAAYDNKKMFEYVLGNIERKIIELKQFYNAGLLKLPVNEKEIYSAFRKMISLDMTYSALAAYAYKDSSLNLPRTELPKEEHLGFEIKDILLDDTYFIDCAYNDVKWYKHLFRNLPLNNALLCESNIPVYFPTLNLAIIGSDNRHRLADSYLKREKTKVKMKVYDDTALFEEIDTDGEYWINKEDGSRIFRASNFKLALIFKLKQIELAKG